MSATAYHDHLGPAIFRPHAAVTIGAARVTPGERALDVACGTGILTVQLPPRVGPTGRVVGLDVSSAMLAVARACRAPDGCPIEWIEASGADTGLATGAFDVVLCQQGLQFFPDRRAGARELRRVLGRGGRAVVACWRGLDEQPVFRALVEAEARHLGASIEQVGLPFSLGDGEALRALFEASGFERVEVSTHTILARFDDPARFVRGAVEAAASVIPAFKGVDAGALVAPIAADCEPALARHLEGGSLVFPMPTSLVVAYAG